MCENLMNLDGDIFEMNFLNEFEELSKDKVKNVRMLVAKVLQKHLRKNGSIIVFIIKVVYEAMNASRTSWRTLKRIPTFAIA